MLSKCRLSEIAADIGFPNNKCGKYLEALIDAGFVVAERFPMGKHSTYYLKNSYLSFWFNYLYRNHSLLVSDTERLLDIVFKDLDARFTKNDLEHYLKAANHHGTAGNTQLMIFSLHRFSDWCVHTASNVPLLFEITTERLRY